MFRRTKSPEPAPQAPVKEGGKGRPTPSRKEAEAAAKARAKAGMDKKAARQLLRERRAAENAKMRQGLKTGDERYLPARDQGPVRRFARDFVDARISMAEFLLPLLVVIMLTQGVGDGSFSNTLWSVTILLVVVDTTLLVFRLRREVRRRFPDEPQKVTGYAILRAMQLRWLRLPKPQVKIGQRLPERS